MTTELYQYQKKGVRKITHFKGRALVADEMGLGKTIQALAWLCEKPEERMPAIIVCPAHLKLNWSREAVSHMNVMAQVLEGRKASNDKLELHPKLIIINYDILHNWAEYILKINAKTLVLDECHYIKNKKAKRTKAVKKISKTFQFTLALSGTPLTNRPAELFPALNVIRPDKFNSFWSFARQFCQLRRDRWGWRFDGAKNMKELHDQLHAWCMIRRRKMDVLTQLPPKRRSIVVMGLENRKEYDKANSRFLEWLGAKDMDKADRASKAEELVKMGYLKRLAAELKMKAVMEWVDDFLEESDEKLVLFAIHQKFIAELFQRYKKLAVTITGKTSPKKKQHAVDSFQHNPKTRLIIGNIQAAGTGLTLTAASNLAFAEIGWTPGEHTQAEDRIHRIGQTQSAHIHYLIAGGTIEEAAIALLEKKFKVLDSVMDGKEETDFDIMAQLRKELISC